MKKKKNLEVQAWAIMVSIPVMMVFRVWEPWKWTMALNLYSALCLATHVNAASSGQNKH